MEIEFALYAMVAGYLLGSLSFARIIGRLVTPDADLRDDTPFPTRDKEKSLRLHAVSATTLSKRAGPRAGMTAGILDVLKVFLPAIAIRSLWPVEPYYLILAVAGMIGHLWPLYHRFRGGRGLSVAFAAFLVVDPLGTFLTWIAGTALGMFVLRDAMFSFLGWMWLMIPWLWFRTHDWQQVALAVAINALLLIAMIPEIKIYARYHKEGIALSFEDGMKTTHMGRGLYKIGVRMGLLKEAVPHEEQQV
jgi:acyl phosphate:glycerol-3-phosphate acyltransferase